MSIEDQLRAVAMTIAADCIKRDPTNKDLYLERLRTYEPRKKNMAELSREEVVRRLRELSELKQGQLLPSWFHGGANTWGSGVADLCKQAADYLEDEFKYPEVSREGA